jgi:hypothetical protein
MRLEDFVDELREISDPHEFREFCDKNLMNLYEPDYIIPSDLKRDVAGVLFYSLGKEMT